MTRTTNRTAIYQFSIALYILFTVRLSAQQSLIGEYYDGRNFEKKVATRMDAKIDFNWMITPPVAGINPQKCSIRWTGKIIAPESGLYTFSAKVDDGIRVWINNSLIIDDWELNDEGNFLNVRLY